MNKELETLERIKEFYPQWRLYNRNDFLIIETALKALEIIKEKEVVISILIRSNTLDEYNNNPMFVSKLLTQEEYDILKEILL